ncbi:MAG TPA: MFS transporter [Anaerolineae bacterium]|nr:MFS transporter [Anaerolineae bacterium]
MSPHETSYGGRIVQERRRTLNTVRRAVFLVSFPFGILAFVLPVYARRLGAGALEIGGLFSAFTLMAVVTRPLVGRVLDRFGRRPFFLAGIGCYLLSQVLFALSRGMGLLYLARITQGLGASLLWLSAYTIVADLVSETKRAGGFGRVDELSARGALYGAFLGFTILGLLKLWTGWPMMFGSYALLSVWALWEARQGVAESRQEMPLASAGGNRLSRPLLFLMLIVFLTGASSAAVRPLLMVFLQDRFTTDVGMLALAFIPAALAYSFLPSRLGRVGDRVGRKPMMILGLLAGGMVSLLIPGVPDLGHLAFLWALEAVCFSASLPAERALVADVAGWDVRGTAYGCYTMASGLGATVGPFLGGWLYDVHGHASPFYLNALVLFLGASLVALLIREHRTPLKVE